MTELAELVELNIALGLSLPKEAATWVIAYLAKRGAGKTYNAAVQAEETVKAGIPIGVIDGMGIWWGLRVSADGKGPGLPIVVFGGEHADLPLDPERATEIARAIVESNISFVLDLSGFSKNVMRKIVMAFLDELYRINRVERHIFIEEADMFAPQKPFGPEAIMCLSSVDNFIRRGGNHNLGCTLITQRTAVLNKDVLTQSDCLVILRTLAPQDKEAIQAWVKEQTEEDKEKLKTFYYSLKDLENGEAWVWHPEKPTIYCRVKFRLRVTFHATREFILDPKASEIKLMPVGEFVSKFKAVFAQTKLPGASVDLVGCINDERLIKDLEKAVNDKLELNKEWNLKYTSLEAKFADQGQKLKESEEYGRKITAMEAERCDQLEDAHKKLKKFDTLLGALVELLPQQTTNAVTEAIVEKSYAVIKVTEEFNQRLKIVEEAVKNKVVQNGGAAVISVTENFPEILHKIERPVVQTDETTREGQMITLAYQGFFNEKKRLNEVAREMQRLYLFTAGNAARDLTPILGRLITWKVLQREEAPGGGWLYWLVNGAKDRIKEAS